MKRVERATLVLLLASALAVALRLWDLGKHELWLDEANAYLMTREGIASLLERLKYDSSPPLFYVVLRFWSQCFGDSEVALRMLSVAGGVLLVPATFFFAKDLFNPRVAGTSAVLCALAPAQIDYSQQVRQYTWLAVAAVACAAALWRFSRRATYGRAAILGVAFLFALYTHNVALYLLPAAAVWFAVSGATRRSLGPASLVAGIVTVGYAPWGPFLLAQLERQEFLRWVAELWQVLGIHGIIAVSLASMIFGPPWTLQTPTFSWQLIIAPLVVSLVLGAALWKKSRRGPEFFVAALFLVPLVTGLTVSLVASQPNFVPGRVDQVVQPFLILLAAAVWSRLSGRWSVPFLALFPVQLLGLWTYFSSARGDGAQRASRELVDQQADTVVLAGLTRAPVEYYLLRAGFQGQILSFPQSYERHLGNEDFALMSNAQALIASAGELKKYLSQYGGRDIGIVFASSPKGGAVAAQTLSAAPNFQLRRVRGPFFPNRFRPLRVWTFRVAGSASQG